MEQADGGALHRVAEQVAVCLRDRVMTGELREGDTLPPLDELVSEFEVSRPSLREALAILESQGLLHVQRGRRGGATIRTPTLANVGFMLAMVLQVQGVVLRDVALAIRVLEPLCAELTTRRADFTPDIVTDLGRLHREASEAVDQPIAFVQMTRQFHERLVMLTGNRTLINIVGILEEIWSVHEAKWAQQACVEGSFPERATREEGIEAHDRIMRRLRRGDAAGVGRAVTEHLSACQMWAIDAMGDLVVDASLMAPGARPPGRLRGAEPDSVE